MDSEVKTWIPCLLFIVTKFQEVRRARHAFVSAKRAKTGKGSLTIHRRIEISLEHTAKNDFIENCFLFFPFSFPSLSASALFALSFFVMHSISLSLVSSLKIMLPLDFDLNDCRTLFPMSFTS